MPARKQTPDILEDLLAPSASKGEHPAQDPGIPVSQDTVKPVHQKTSVPVSRDPGIPVKRRTSKKAPPPKQKIKATFYLSQEAADALEDGWHALRKLAPAGIRAQIGKSLIVEQVLLLALQELRAKGEDSPVARRVLQRG